MKRVLIFLISISFCLHAEEINVAALKGPTGLSMVQLIHNNQNLGIETNYSVVGTPQLVIAGLLSESYNIAALPTNLASIIFNKKPDYSIIAVTGEGTLYIVSSDKSISSWNDLNGKKVYNIARSSTPGFLFDNLLKREVNKPEVDVDFTYNHVELAPLLIAGKVTTGVLPEPLVTNVLLKNPDMKVVLDFQETYKKFYNASYPLSCIVASNDLISKHPEVIENFLKELEDSINWVKTNPKEAGNLGAEVGLGVNGVLVETAMPRLNIGFQSIEEVKGTLESYYQILYNSDPKSIGGKLPSNGFYYKK